MSFLSHSLGGWHFLFRPLIPYKNSFRFILTAVLISHFPRRFIPFTMSFKILTTASNLCTLYPTFNLLPPPPLAPPPHMWYSLPGSVLIDIQQTVPI